MRSIPRGDTFININRYTRCHVAVSQWLKTRLEQHRVYLHATHRHMINGRKRRERWAWIDFSLIYPRFVCSPFWIARSVRFFFFFFFSFPRRNLKRSSTSLASLRRVIISDKSNCIPSRRSSSRSTRRLRVTTLPSLPGEKKFEYIFPSLWLSDRFIFTFTLVSSELFYFSYRLNVMDSVPEWFWYDISSEIERVFSWLKSIIRKFSELILIMLVIQ